MTDRREQSVSVAQTGADTARSVGPVLGSAKGLPGNEERWRCGACGNLTRFDVVRTATTREYWHLELAGDPRVEDVVTIDHAVSSISCRWCGRNDAIEVVSRPGSTPP